MNPNGYAGATANQFKDATPFAEGCDRESCTSPVGGEHSEKCVASIIARHDERHPEGTGCGCLDGLEDYAPGELTELWGK